MDVATLACLFAATLLLLRLHLARTGLSPVRDAVSDYGTTPWHLLYRAMVVALGASAALLAIQLNGETDAGALEWLWIFAVTRIAIAGFMTDRDPPPFTHRGPDPLRPRGRRVHRDRLRRRRPSTGPAGPRCSARSASRSRSSAIATAVSPAGAARRLRPRRAAALRDRDRLAGDRRDQRAGLTAATTSAVERTVANSSSTLIALIRLSSAAGTPPRSNVCVASTTNVVS